ncbi:MAG: cytochrome C oxidase subunit IV family protein [Ignavibacteriales bacterium]|nr:cytochrome C oxidase subunit IV family protein [Ignavibacteriales bacterium]
MNASHRDEMAHAPVGYGRLVLLWLGLLGLTGLTVGFAGIELGSLVVVTSLLIASTKAVLVLNVFMHLRFEDRVFRFFVAAALAVLVIFFALTFMDYGFHG